MEMFFLGSMLIAVIVTNFAWEPVSQDFRLVITQQQCILPREVACNPFSLAILCQNYLRMNALGKGLMELLKP